MTIAVETPHDEVGELLERLAMWGEWKHLGSPLLPLLLLDRLSEMQRIRTACARRIISELRLRYDDRAGPVFWRDEKTPKRIRKLIDNCQRDDRRTWRLRSAERDGLSYERALTILEHGP